MALILLTVLFGNDTSQIVTASTLTQVPEPIDQKTFIQPTIRIWDVSWIPADSQPLEGAIDLILKGTGLSGLGHKIIEYSKKYGVNPILALAMFKGESSFAFRGTRAYVNNNPGNIIATGNCRGSPKGSFCRGIYGEISTDGRFGVYASMVHGIKAFFIMLSTEYKPGKRYNCDDMTCVISSYCTLSKPDKSRYIAQIKEWMKNYQTQLN